MKIEKMLEFSNSSITINTKTPRFSWVVPFSGRAKAQSAYRILVSSSPELLAKGQGDIWDSGKCESAQSVNILYGGKEFLSNKDYFWSVNIWDEKGNESGFSESGKFSTGLDEKDWNADWIGLASPDEPVSIPDTFHPKTMSDEVRAVEPEKRAPQMRKNFDVNSKVKRAKAFVCGVGLFEFRLNGAKVGADVLATPRTDFLKTLLYTSYDITDLLKYGKNTAGLILGNGWYCGHKKYWGWQQQWYGSHRGIVQIEIEFENGKTQRVVSDNSWRGDWSPITFNCIYDGEDYDARLEQSGWDTPEFNDSSWKNVNILRAPGGKLIPLSHEPEMKNETVKPVSMMEPVPGIFVYDMGKNMTGWVRIRIKNAIAGSKIGLRFTEEIKADGSVEPKTNGNARQADYYIMKGSEEEFYEPRFTYHGFQYVELTGYPGIPEIEDMTGYFIHNSVSQTGRFESSSELVNKIHKCTLQSQLCNIQMGVPTDDTQRSERLGWGADAWACAEEALYNLWMPSLYEKWIKDFNDQQDPSGLVGMITPRAGIEEDMVWSAAFFMVAYFHYLHYGDKRILRDSYKQMNRYMEYLEATGRKEIDYSPLCQADRALFPWTQVKDRYAKESERGYLQKGQWGEHIALWDGFFQRSDLPLSMPTAFYFLDASLMAKIAGVLGEKDDVKKYKTLSFNISEAFNKRFYNSKIGCYDGGMQSAQAWSLVFGLAQGEQIKNSFRILRNNIQNMNKGLSSGYTATMFVIKALSMNNHNSLLWQLVNSENYPSWGYMLKNNRSTTTEYWDGVSGSLNHAALGAAIDAWFYSDLAGISPDESVPGYELINIKPYIPADLQWVRASVKTLRGTLVSSWRKLGNETCLNISIPANCRARVVLPAKSLDGITESGVPLNSAEGIKILSQDADMIILETVSGDYTFKFPSLCK